MRWISQLKHYKKAKKKKGLITWTGPVLAGNRLILLNSEGEMVFASPTDGSVQGKVDAGKNFDLPPIVANSTIYVVDDDPLVLAFLQAALAPQGFCC